MNVTLCTRARQASRSLSIRRLFSAVSVSVPADMSIESHLAWAVRDFPLKKGFIMRRLAALLILTFAFVGTPIGRARAEDAFFFKSGDRVLFLGDSITEQYQYSTDIELYLTTRFPKWNLFFLNAGIGGDTAQGGNGRFAAHVLAEKPTAITINFGMNDGGYGALNTAARDNFAKNTEDMLKAAKEAGVRVAVVSPNAVDTRIQERFKL